MKICDLTQFYSPNSGGVKRYVGEKVRYLREHSPGDEHVLIVPGEADMVVGDDRARVYTIASPLISRTSRYRVLLRLEAVERVLERERPSIVESGDPYQVGWKAVRASEALGIPVVGFYHSHFAEAYVRLAGKYLGRRLTEWCVELTRRYVRGLYNRFERTIVPSPALGDVLRDWGVERVVHCDLGVDTEVFRPEAEANEDVQGELGIPRDAVLFLYVGRLAQEKNTHTLFEAFRLLAGRTAGMKCHLLVVGDGLQRVELEELRAGLVSGDGGTVPLTHVPYCSEAERLARFYRAAAVFVHPGVQETFGLVSLEAQSCGTPVVGIAGSYMDRIIHHDQSLWAKENTPRALATAMEAMGREGVGISRHDLHRTIAARYSWMPIFARLFDLYREVIQNYRRP